MITRKINSRDYNLVNHFRDERSIEVPIGVEFLKLYSPIIEVGAVLTDHKHKIGKLDHEIVDLFQRGPNIINKDAEDCNFKNKNVLSISTIEHMGALEYGNKNEDLGKPQRAVEKIHNEANKYLLSFPSNHYNKEFTRWLFKNIQNYDWFAYKKTSKENVEYSVWEYYDDELLNIPGFFQGVKATNIVFLIRE